MSIKQRIRTRTGFTWGVANAAAMPSGTSLGQPRLYLRISDGRDGLVPFEIGNSRKFFYVMRCETGKRS